MLQTLLADRFAMRAHFETREMPAYILTVAKGSPRMRFLGSEDCIPFDSTKLNPKEVPNVCGNNHIYRNGWDATHISMQGVTSSLGAAMGRPVALDQTGIKGTFDVRVRWSEDPRDAGHFSRRSPSIYVSLRETLGLELKSGRGPVQVLVIDHIERPTANWRDSGNIRLNESCRDWYSHGGGKQ